MTTKLNTALFLLCLFFSTAVLTAQEHNHAHDHAHKDTGKDPLLFVPNQNQWHPNVRFKADLGGINALYLEDKTLTYLFHDQNAIRRMHDNRAEADTMTWRSHSYKIHFMGANNSAIKGFEKQPAYHNYFHGNDPNKWAGKVPVFHGVRYENLYDGIQLKAYSQDGNFKYDFVLEAGADPTHIQMHYDGVDQLYLEHGNLHIKTSVEQITEHRPYAYQIINGETQIIACEYQLSNSPNSNGQPNNTLTFHFPKGYNNRYPLVIDPVVVAATLSGATTDNWGFTATFDVAGNIYAGGASFNPGYPTTIGAFQEEYGGGVQDIAVTKYTPDGSQQIYATYIGGSFTEQPHSMIVDFNGQLCIYGTSNSENYPTTTNAIQSQNGGNYDIVVTKLNSDGSALVGSTYIGGSEIDGVNQDGVNYGDINRGEIVLDAQGNIHIASSSTSDDFPVTSNAFQGTKGTDQDAIVMKLNSDLSTLFWATFLGGSDDDIGLGLRVKEEGSVIVTGKAANANFPVGTGGFQANWPGNNASAFVVELSSAGQEVLHSTFFGSSDGQDYSYFIDLDEDDQVHIYGQTSGSISVTPNTYFATADSKQFLAGFSADLSDLVYSTVIGTGPSIFGYDFAPVAFMVDKCNGIYFSGYHAKGDLPTTADAISDFGDDDFFLAKLTPNAAELEFATYYNNSTHVDGGTSRFDKAGIVYQAVCSCAPANVMNTLPTAYSQANSPNCSAGVFKIDFEIETVTAAAFASPSTSGCVPLTIDFTYSGSDAETFFWDFGTGDTSTEENPSYTFTEAGTYNVMQVVNAPNTCNGVDTFYLQIDVLNNSSTLTDTVFCPGNVDLFLDASIANADYLWQDGSTGATFQVNNPGTYWVDVNVGNCVRRDSFIVESPSSIEVDLGEDQSFCDVSSITLNASDPSAAAYLWNNGQNTPSLNVGTSGQYTVTLFDSIGCFTSDTIELLFTNTPQIDLGPDQTLCEGDEWLLDATTSGATYNWQDGSTEQTITVTETGTYSVEVDLNGCVGTDEFTAVFSPPLPVELGDDQSVCDIFTFTLDASVAGAATYEWATGETDPVLEITNSGNYIVTVTNDLGCETIDNITITFSLTPEIQLAADSSLCDGETLSIAPVLITSGVPYSWQDGSNTPVYTVTSEGLYWALADADGCFDSDSIYISYTPLPIVNYEMTEIECHGDSTASLIPINPTSINDFDFLWSNGFATGEINELPAGNYQLTVTDENDCVFTNDFTITQPDPLTFVLAKEDVPCFGDGTGAIIIDSVMGGIPPYLFSLNSDTLLPNLIYNNLDGGDYSVAAVDVNDCETTAEIFLYEPPQVFLSAGEDKIIDLGDSVKIDGFLFPEFNQIINWTSEEYVNCLNCIQPYGQPLRTADFVITSVDSITGCTLRDTMRINVEKPRNIYIPNAFSPNGDGSNDLFYPFGDISARRFTYFRVFDRWGELVHEANDFKLGDPKGGWDGRLKGEFMNPGVFAYIVEVEFVDGVVKRYKGDVTLVK